MDNDKIKEVVTLFVEEAKKVYGVKLHDVILYGSCARGDFSQDSDIDILVLLDVSRDLISQEQKKIFSVSDKLDLEYDVVLTPIFQSYQVYQQYLNVSRFYQNVEKEGVRIA